jgi:hypothetical protein
LLFLFFGVYIPSARKNLNKIKERKGERQIVASPLRPGFLFYFRQSLAAFKRIKE